MMVNIITTSGSVFHSQKVNTTMRINGIGSVSHAAIRKLTVSMAGLPWVDVQDDVIGVLDKVLSFEQIRELGDRMAARSDYKVSH
jgi:hypothetical protein